jgi:hypothetical protein
MAAHGLREQIVDRGGRRFEVHELRLAFGCGDFILAEFVAILAGEIALIGEIHHHGLQGKIVGQRLGRIDKGLGGGDDAGLIQFADCFQISNRQQFFLRRFPLR